MTSGGVDTFVMVAAAGALLAAAGVVVYALGRFGTLNAPAFGRQIRKLLDADNRDRAIKLCQAVAQSAAVYRLTLFLLGQQIPSRTMLDDPTGGYRASAPTRDFADLLQERVAGALAARRRPLVRRAVVNAVLFVVAGAIAVPLWLWGRPATPLALRLAPIAQGTAAVAAFGAVFVLVALRKDLRGLDRIIEETLPALRPVEEMSEADRKAAERAMELLSGTSGKGQRHAVPDAPRSDVLLCAKCGRENSPTLKWCLGCGAELQRAPSDAQPAKRFCPFCAQEIPPTATACSYCGKRLSD